MLKLATRFVKSFTNVRPSYTEISGKHLKFSMLYITWAKFVATFILTTVQLVFTAYVCPYYFQFNFQLVNCEVTFSLSEQLHNFQPARFFKQSKIITCNIT